ncbi:elongation factor P [Candidatus Peregrinibacteria bacterium]|nr:MAG: elongation factor P [Candidatus Peregrinibacteria bacterium]
MYSLGELRVGHTIVLDDEPFLVTYCQHSKQARGTGVLKTTLKNLKTGNTIPRTFQGNEKLQPADVGYFRAQYLYKNGDGYEFMNNESYEQFTLSQEILGEDSVFLKEGEDVDIQHFRETPIRIQFPPSMSFLIQETPPGVKGDTAQGGTKPATLENGMIIQVPLFVEEGDIVQMNTETRVFQKRVQ